MTTGHKPHGAVLCVLALSLAIPGLAQAFLLYTPDVLGRGTPVALNDSGQVVGRSHDARGELTATLWEPGDEAPRYLLPGKWSTAYDVNEGGAVLAGIYGHKYVLLTDEGTTDLPPISAQALNNLLQVVSRGSIWEAGEVRSIDGVSGMDINDRGQVAGVHSTLGAVVWEDGTITPVGPGELRYPEAGGINELGQAVGIGQNEERKKRAFYWDGVASVVLAALSGESAWAWALNDRSQIVGWSETGTRERRAVLWEDGAIADLNDLLTEPFPYTLVEAVDINNRGQIACRAVDSRGIDYAVLLTPIPEPGTILLLAAGAALAGRRRRRR